MNRRSFLTAALTAAAALGLPVSAAAAETPEVPHDPLCPCRFDMSPARVTALTATNGTFSEAVSTSRWGANFEAKPDAEVVTITTGGGNPGDPPAQIEYVYDPPFTFEAMQADCKALGCQLDEWRVRYSDNDPYFVEKFWHQSFHPSGDGRGSSDYCYSTDLARVDAWRRSLHEAGG